MERKPTERNMEYLDKWTRRSAITHGIPDDRLIEICRAERDGRISISPCKIGQIVYEIRFSVEKDRKGKGNRKRVDHSLSVSPWRLKEQPNLCYVAEKKYVKSDSAYIGRTIFLSHEEAEIVLKGYQNGQDL